MQKNSLPMVSCAMMLLGAMLMGMPISLSAAPTSHLIVAQQNNKVTVKGTITDQEGEPIVGASIAVTGTSTGVISDVDGKFSIDVLSGAKLTISYVGFLPQTITVKSNAPLNIILQEDQQSLNEVVVVGYGQQKKVDLTGSVAAISEKDLA